MALQTWVARFVVDHGSVTEEGGRLRTFQRRRLDEPDVDLHILCEPAGVKGDDLGAQALDAIGRLFLQDRLSLTGGLQRALHATNQTLLEWNRRSVPREQVQLGIAGVIVAGNVVHVCQLGPSLVYLRSEGRLERLPAGADGPPAPLGDGELETLMRRIDLAPGDMLLAASPSLDQLIDPRALNSVLDRGSDEALPELYLRAREQTNFALFAITCFEDTAAQEPDDDMVEEEELPSTTWARPQSSSRPSDAGDADAPAPGTALVTPPPVDISRPLVRLRSEQSFGRGDYARTTGTRSRFTLAVQPRFAVLGAAVMLVLFVGVFTVPDLIREGRAERFAIFIDGASTQLAAAAAEQDAGRRRDLLEEANRLASEALRIDADHPAAVDLRQQATGALIAMDAVFELSPMTTLAILSRQVTGEISVLDLTVTATTAYLLDEGSRRVIAVPRDGTATSVIYQDGQTYGNVQAKQPLFITWEGSSANGRLLILDADRKLFELRPGGQPSPVVLRRPGAWQSAGGIAAYDSNLYVLDPAANQVHRYLPAAAGFDSEPAATLTGQNQLAGAGFITVDGDIFVGLESGEIKRFRGGVDIGFSLNGIDRPLKTVTGIAVQPGSGEVFIADAGNKRVVVATRDGVFRRQFVSNDFTDLRTVAVDPTGATLYAVAGDTLLFAPIVR
jgi:DNA-binding beta-propeller fold protein YncE